MRLLNLPTFNYKIQNSKAGCRIFDAVRRKYVKLTPEEWVRQHFLHYLVDHLAYPSALVRVEKGVPHYSLRYRPDIVLYNRCGQPFMLVECKAPHVTVSNQEIWGQIGRYNAYLNASLLVVTNGLEHFCWYLDHASGGYRWLSAIPHFDESAEYFASKIS